MPPVPPALPQWPRGPRNKLHVAAMGGYVDRAKTLLSKGSIDINQGTPGGLTPLMLASMMGHESVVKILLSEGANASIEIEGLTALCHAVGGGYIAVTKMLLKAGGERAMALSGALVRPLRVATEQGQAEAIKVLIEAGADVNAREPGGEYPLFSAAAGGYVGAVRELLRAKADPLLSVPNADGDEYLPLGIAAHGGHLEVVRELLQQVGIDACGGPSRGYRALCSAAQENHVDIMRALTGAGVADMGDILNCAAGDGLEGPVKFLIGHQAGKFIGGRSGYLNYRNAFGSTPLLSSIFFCKPNSPRIVQLLIEAGANATFVVRLMTEPSNKFIPGVPVGGGVLGEYYFKDTPLAFTNCRLRDKKVRGEDATKQQLRTLEAVRRLLMRVEAVGALSWLWPGSVAAADAAAAKVVVSTRAMRTSTKIAATAAAAAPLRVELPILRRGRTDRRGAMLAALFRWVSLAVYM